MLIEEFIATLLAGFVAGVMLAVFIVVVVGFIDKKLKAILDAQLVVLMVPCVILGLL
jgi:capsular polysaccharide biosynthesis protein